MLRAFKLAYHKPLHNSPHLEIKKKVKKIKEEKEKEEGEGEGNSSQDAKEG